MGRSFGDALGVLLGRSPLRFCFEITPQAVGDVPDGVTAVAVHWEKGSKVSYTEPAHVDPDGTAVFAQVMRQTATIYKQGNALLPKHYTFKVQSVKPPTPSSSSSTNSGTYSLSADSASRISSLKSSCKTIARARLDLAQFCSAESTPSSVTEVCVPLEPQGALTLSIKTVWLQHYDHARSAELLQQGEGSSSSQAWGSSSDTNTDKSSVRSSMYGSAMYDADRDTCSGSAELDKLLQEAEAATAAKAVAPSTPGRSPAASTPALPPKVVTLHSLSTTPRGPSRPQHSRAHSTGTFECHQPQQQQWGVHHTNRSVLDVLGQPRPSASPFHGLTPDSIEAGSAGSSSGSSCSSRPDRSSILPFERKGHWHRRASSAPDTPTILETDREGPEGTSFTGMQRPGLLSTAVGAGAATKPSVQQDAAGARLPFGLRPSTESSEDHDDSPSDAEEEGEDATAQWMQACRPFTPPNSSSSSLQQGSSDGPEALRSLSGRMPTWLWPTSRMAVRDLTTDQIMRRIGCSRDVGALQHMCRGLLCERNDWRFRATQAERINEGLQQELQQLRGSQAGTQQQELQQLRGSQAGTQQQQQLSEGQLLSKLVGAKLELAQADLTTQALKGQLERERKRHMQALAQLTNMQATLDEFIDEQNAAGVTGAGCKSSAVGCCVY